MLSLNKLHRLFYAYTIKIMGGDDMQREYEFLCEFTNNTYPSEQHLIKRYGKEAFLKAIEIGWIEKFTKNELGEWRYTITESGKRRRDN